MAAPSMTLAQVYQSRYDYIGIWIMRDVYRFMYPLPIWIARMPVADAEQHCSKWRDDWHVAQDSEPLPF